MVMDGTIGYDNDYYSHIPILEMLSHLKMDVAGIKKWSKKQFNTFIFFLGDRVFGQLFTLF